MELVLTETVSAVLRWLHVIAGIAWIGSSFYFIHLDAGRQPGARLEAEVKVDKVKRAADPRDASNNVQPAEDGAYGLSEY